MFKCFRKEASNQQKSKSVNSIEAKRQVVTDAIDKWLMVIAGASSKNVIKLSKITPDCRLVWMKYANQNIPLNDEGDLVGEIELTQDEAEFWQWMWGRVIAGDYDRGIMKIASTTGERLRQGRNCIKPGPLGVLL